MTKLSNTQAEILSAAAGSEEGFTTPPADAKSAVAGLIKRGFLISLPQPEGPSRLLITDAGRDAIAPATPQEEPGAEAAAPAEPPAKPRGPTGPLVAISLRRRPAQPAAAESAPKPPPSTTVAAAAPPKGKIGALIGLLRQPGGTTVEAMMAATGWQAHSVRGAMSGAIKKGLGLEVISEKTETGRTYRVAAEA